MLKIGIAYTKSNNKKKSKKLYFHKQSKHDNKIYKYHDNKRYQLSSIRGHQLVYDNKPDYKAQLWWDVIDIPKVQKRIDKDKDKENEDIDLERNAPHLYFGVLMFECEWDDWPEITLERWEVIMRTSLFEDYCDQKDWKYEGELSATIQQHSDEEFQKIICNMARFGSPVIRKALKVLINKEFNMW